MNTTKSPKYHHKNSTLCYSTTLTKNKFLPYLHLRMTAPPTYRNSEFIYLLNFDFLLLYRASLPLHSENSKSFYSIKFLYLNS